MDNLHACLSSYFKEAPAPVGEAAGGRSPWRCAGGHVFPLTTGLGDSHAWVCCYVWDGVWWGQSSVGQNTHFSGDETRGNSCFSRSQCYRGAGWLEGFQSDSLSVRLSVSSFPSLLAFTSSLFLLSLPLICPSSQIIASALFISVQSSAYFRPELLSSHYLSLQFPLSHSHTHFHSPFPLTLFSCPHT